MSKAATTYQSAQDAVRADDNVIYHPIYVLPASSARNPTIDYTDAVRVVYADRSAQRVRVGRKAYDVWFKLVGCGVNAVPCIFY